MRVKSIIAWTDNMRVGVEQIDDDHKQLIAEISSLYPYRKTNSKAEVKERFSEIVSHTARHFTAEVALMDKIRFPGTADHVAVHGAFIEQLMDLELRMATDPDYRLDDKDLNGVARWLFNHILTEDKDFAVHAAQHPPAMVECE